MKHLVGTLALSTLLACGGDALPPRGQLVLWVDTDAPLVAGDEVTAADRLGYVGLFDRLRIDILDSEGTLACAECSRDFVVTQKQLDEGKLSIGVRLAPNVSGRARARLFSTAAVRGTEPPANAAIDGVFALPSHGADGIVEATAFLAFDELGKAADVLATPPDALAGRVLQGKRAVPPTRRSCASEPAQGEVCVPSGTYWGSRVYASLVPDEEFGRALMMSPFFLDDHEVTVAELRAAHVATETLPARASKRAGCTYTDERGATDQLPVNCLSFEVAEAYCAQRGGSLPTLAQSEYVNSGLRGDAHVWGVDAPTCDDAVWARGGDYNTCASLGGSPSAAGTGTRDRLALPGGEILDLAGNVSELLADSSAKMCRHAGVESDPVCGPFAGLRSFGGGNYLSGSAELISPFRTTVHASGDEVQPHVGFRCARPGE